MSILAKMRTGRHLDWEQFFIVFAGGVLFAAGLNRLLIAAGTATVLDIPDPLFGISIRYATLVVGLTDLAVAWVCLFGKTARLQLDWILWLTTLWAISRAGFLWQHTSIQWTFLGLLTNPLRLSFAAWVEELAPIGLFIGALGFIIHDWRRGSVPSAVKMSCPACGVHIRFAIQNLGQNIVCPGCRSAVILRSPEENLKMSCYFCKGRIEFPAHAIGEKFKCPHCHMDISLKEPAAA